MTRGWPDKAGGYEKKDFIQQIRLTGSCYGLNERKYTATNSQEAAEFEKSCANLVFRPFKDATEQAADALTYAMGFLPESVDWPVSFLELRIRSDASAAGQTIRELPLSASDISVLAVSRGGRIVHEPKPDFRIFPADRLLLMGHPDGLKEAETILNQLEAQRGAEDTDRFEIAEIKVSGDSDFSGKSLAELHFRQKFGATLVGIRRGQDQITAINPAERLLGGGLYDRYRQVEQYQRAQ